MDNRRLLLALALCVAFMIGWSILFPPPRPKPPAGAAARGASAGAATGGAPGSAGAAGAAPGTPSPAGPAGVTGASGGPATTARLEAAGSGPAASGPSGSAAASRSALLPSEAVAGAAEETIRVDTPLLAISLTNRGARVASWVVKSYKDARGEPLDLVSPSALKVDRMPLDLQVDDPDASARLRGALYRVERSRSAAGSPPATILTFTWSDGHGLSAAKALTVPDDSYLAELQVAAEVGGRPVTPAVGWGAGFESEDAEVSVRYGVGTRAVADLNGRIEHRFQDKITPDAPWIAEGAVAWAGLESKYFASIMVPQEGGEARVRVESLKQIEEGREHLHLMFWMAAPGASHLHLFVGPKDYDTLKALGLGLEHLLDFGFFGFIALPLFYALKFLYRYVGNYGWAIVLLTVGIRLVFFPFMHKSQIKMRLMQEKMKRIQPRLKALRERYHRLEKKEAEKGKAGARHRLRQEMNEEMMKVYSDEGINPFSSMSGCLPLLAQMPILWSFYTILTIAIDLRHAPFLLWVKDLSIMDPFYVTPLLMGATMLVQQLMTSSAIPDPAQRRMMYVMPVMFTWFFMNLPSGLVLYWLVNNLLGIVQQYLVNKEADARKAAPSAA